MTKMLYVVTRSAETVGHVACTNGKSLRFGAWQIGCLLAAHRFQHVLGNAGMSYQK